MVKKSIKHLGCSFCGRQQEEVLKLVAGPDVYICEACVDLCVEIITEQAEESGVAVSKYLPAVSKLSVISTNKDIDLSELGLAPRFNKLRFKKKQKHCFYLCPFVEPFNTIYSDHVRPSIESAGFTIERADEIFGTQPIIEDIWEGINSSEIVIADVTNRNPNVMYEIGMAHTVGKPVVIMTQNLEDVPFDLKHHRCIMYAYTPKGCAALEEKISGTLRFISGLK